MTQPLQGNSAAHCLIAGLLLLSSLSTLAAPEVTPNFPNVAQTPGELLSGLNAPEQGRTAVIAYHGGILYTIPEMPASEPGSDFQVRSWNIANPRSPQILAQHGQTPHPVDAHGYFKSGVNLVLGSDYDQVNGPWNFVATGSDNEVNRAPFGTDWWGGYASRGNIFGPRGVGPIFWSYNAIEQRDMVLTDSQGRAPYADVTASWDHLGMTGVLGFPIIFGNRLIVASDQSQTGIATYDISDRTNPVLLDVLKTGGPGGYFPELWGEDGELYVVFPHRMEPRGHGFQVADITDMSNMRHVGDYDLPGDEPMYVQFQDNYAFMGSHKVDMRTHQSVLNLHNMDIPRPDGGRGVSVSQFALPLGNLLITGGVNQHQGMAIWAHQATPDTRAPTVGFHIPQAAQTHYPVDAVLSFLIHETLETFTIVNGDSFSVRPLLEDGTFGDFVAGELVFAYNDILTFTPHTSLADNTTYQVTFAENGIKDAAGNGMAQYQFTFSTGSAVGGNTPPSMTSLSASTTLLNINQSVALTAVATDAAGDTLQYRFDFGDGSARSAWQSTNSISHSFAAEGHFRVVAQVRDQAGLIATQSTVLTVTNHRPTAAPALHSAPLYLDASNQRLWVVNPDNDSVTVLNSGSYQIITEVSVCDSPVSITQDSNDTMWVSCKHSDEIVILDGSASIIERIPLDYGSGPSGIVRDLAGDAIYVALESKGQVLRFNSQTRQADQRAEVGRSPSALAIDRNNSQLLVTQFISEITHGNVWQLSPEDLSLQRTIHLDRIGGAQHRDGTAEGKGIPNYVSAIMQNAAGTRGWLTATKVNTDRGLLTGVDLDQDNTVRTVIMELDLVSGGVMRSIDLDNSDSASHLSFSPLEDYLLVALQGNNKVMALDMLDNGNSVGLGSLVTSIPTGGAPQGIVLDAASGQAWVKNLTGRSVSRIDLTQFFASGAISVPSTEITTVQDETMSLDILRGKTLFYHASDERMSGEGYISCASCHNDGGSDGRIWDFTGRGEGLRNTTSLLGKAGTAQGNVHWTGNFDEIHDFENDIRFFFGGSGFLSDNDFQTTSDTLGAPKQGLNSDLDALAAYVSSLGDSTLKRSPNRATDGTFTSEAQAGSAVFNTLNCQSCHSGAYFTDSTLGSATLHNVGTISDNSGGRMGATLSGLDTPTLLGLWDNAPYFHDGSAAHLEAVFRSVGGTTYPAEEGSISGMGWMTTQWTELNYDGTVRGGGLATLVASGDSLVLDGIDGGNGGEGQLRIRHNNENPSQLNISVGDFNQSVTIPAVRSWSTLIIDNVPLQSGSNNRLTMTLEVDWRNIDIDEVTVATAEQIVLAAPHRQVLSLTQTEQHELISYLLQLDGQSVGQNGDPDPDTGDENPPEEPEAQPPIAHITGDAEFTPGTTISLSASTSTDPEGQVLTYQWTQTSGTSLPGFPGNQENLTITVPGDISDQQFTISLMVTDPDGLSDSVSYILQRSQQNQPPVASIDGPTSGESGMSMTLSASASQDPDGNSLQFSWTQVGGTNATLSNTETANLLVTLPTVSTDETLLFALVVSDSQGATATLQHSLLVTAPDVNGIAPVAQTTGNVEAIAGDWVLLDGRSSYDANGDELVFHWRQIAGDTVEIPWPNASFVQFQVPANATTQDYQFELTVTDATDLSDTTVHTLAVSANSAPVGIISGVTTETVGRYVELSAEYSYDVNGHAIHFLWEQLSGPAIDIAWPKSSKLGFHTPIVDTQQDMVFRLTLTDDYGASSQYQHTVTVRTSFAPVIITQHADEVSAGQYLSLDASESMDPDGDSLSFLWQQTTGPTIDIAWPTSPTIGFHAPYVSQNTALTFQLTVTDAVGSASQRDVIVNVLANQAPVIDADIPATLTSGQSVYMNAWGSYDPEGAQVSFNWQYVSGPYVEFAEPDAGGFMFTAPEVKQNSILTIKLVTMDEAGATSEQQFAIQLLANLAPVIVTDEWPVARTGEFLVLDATASYDPEGQNVWYFWEQLSGPAPKTKWGEWTDKLNIQLPDDQTGAMVFKVTVTDESGKASDRQVTLTIQP